MLRYITQFGLWFAVLVIGFVFLSAQIPMSAAGSGAGTGFFAYRFRATFNIWPDGTSDTMGRILVEGNAARRFRLWGHASPAYKEVELEWDMFNGSDYEGRASLNLEQMTIETRGETTDIDQKSLSALLGFSPTNPRDAEYVAAILNFLRSARDGALFPPNHHGHELPEPLPGRMQHFASGPSLYPLQLLWVIGWMMFGLMKLFRGRPDATLEANRT